ncbi:ankyrin repeat domain-containing protein 26 isoform X2 [Myiozetetes cayanensis]|uniref:ankyrin repeat domain-containing protein 26 isoform X2 n=1 Tax=Myiozetetes cayanensis TaxID=478635 RepID=UPI002160A703|nr:ankyrin repeat domain-containing protein 26 isoform X2 [Myiozetetes cayanensis]
MKRIFGFGRKRKGQPPPGSASLPCPAGAYELRQKDLGKLHRAAASGDLAQVRQGLRKYGIDGRDKAERTPLHLACASGHVDVVTYLVENQCKLNLFDNDNKSPLMKAVQCQQEKCVAILLEHGADPNLADADGNTALHLAVLSPNTAVAGLLLEHNANINAQNKEGCTPLILAVSERHEEIMEFLLKKGANVHARDQCERTPLMTAASGGEVNLIKVLLQYGADVSHKDTNGWTAEDYAVIHGYSSLSKQLGEYADWENTVSAGGAQGITVPGTPHRAGAAAFMLGAPAVDRGGMQQSPNQTSRTGKSRKADDFSQGDSIRTSEKEGSDDSWHTSEEEELDFTPKKLQKPNLTLLMNASQHFRKNNDGDGSRIESPKSPKKSLKQQIPSDANLNKGGTEELFNQDVSAASNLEEEELEEEEEEEEEEDDDENHSGDGDEDDEEEEEEDEDFTEDEEEEEELEDEEAQSSEILEEEQGEKTEPKGEINGKLEYFSKAKYEEEAQCETGAVCIDDKISKEHDEKGEESVDTPVSFIAGCYERLQENKTSVSPKIMNNEVSCKSVPKQAVFQNLNNLQDTQESWNRKSMIQEKFHRNADSCFVNSEMTDWKKGIPQPLSDSCGLKEKKSSFSDDFESDNNSWSAAKNPGLEREIPSSVIVDHVSDEDTEEEQYEGAGDKICDPLKQENENLRLNRHEENLRAFHSSTKEESPEQEEKVEEEKQEKEDTGEKLQTTVTEDVKNSVCNDISEVHDASKDKSGTLPAVRAEQEEDAESPWDSEADSQSLRKVSSSMLLPAAERHEVCSHIVSGEHNNGFFEKPNNSQLKTPKSALEINETSPKNRQQKSDLLQEFGLEDAEDIEGEFSGSTFHMSSSAEKDDVKDALENYGVWDKYILETTNLIEKRAHENQTDKAEISHQEALAENEESHSADKELSLKPWEERYEKLWIEKEKRELKTNFKNITAELKQLFGENETGKTASYVKEIPEDGFGEKLKSSFIISSPVTESSSKLESKGEFGDTKLILDGKVPQMKIVIPSLGILPDENSVKANVEDTWNRDEEDGTNNMDNRKVSLAKGEKKRMPTIETEENDNGSSENAEEGPAYSLRHSLKSSILGDISNTLPKIRTVSTSDENAVFVTERKFEKYSGFNDDVHRNYLINNNNIGETEIESIFANAQQSCGMLERNLDEELKQDMERFKSKVGMLQIVFLALEKEKVQLQQEVEKEKSKQRCLKMQKVAKQEDVAKLSTPPDNITSKEMKEKLTLRKNDCLKMENEDSTEEKDKKNFSAEERSKLIKRPLKGEFALNPEVAKMHKRQTLKQAANQQMSSCSGNHFQTLDDSTFSETSQDEERPAAKTGSEKNKVGMDVTDDLDLTHSSDTTSEDVALPTSTYKEALLLLEQLSVDHTGSAILLKIQNILLKYEQIIEHEKNRYTAVCKEVRKLESEKEESQLIAEETQDLKSILAHQEVEWKSDIQSLKFTLKQEEEKRVRVEALYEKTREKLIRQEEQYCKEVEEKQQLELQSRNLEMELLTLRKLLKQVEEERDETQRQLSQEKSARALQEGILNNHLWRQKELEEETRRTIGKNSDESDTEREKDLLYKNQLLQDEIAVLRLELDQIRLRHQEEEGKYLEENETLKEKNEDLKKELKLNEEALTQTVFQYNGQLNLLKTESAMLTSKLEQTKESKDRLETEIESFRSRLNTTVQELERHQSSKSDAERTFQRERDEWLRLQDKLHHDLSDVRETNKSLSQQLSKAESKANGLENELHQLKQMLREKMMLLEMTQKELSQAQCQAKEYDHARQLEKDQVSKLTIKQESMQERLAQLQSENLLLRQQLEDVQNKGIIKEKVVNDVQDRFNDIFNKLRADTEKQVYLVEERNKELNAKCTDLREQVFKYETDKIEREGMVRQLQQELADALKKQSMSEASLEVTTRYRSDLEEDKLRLQKELEKVKAKLRAEEEKHLQSEHCVRDLKTALDDKEREAITSAQKLQDLLLASSESNATIKQLEEHVQHLEIENTRLEATVQQQNNRIEVLQRDLQSSASVHNRLEDLITSLRTSQAAAEDHHKQVQKQNALALTSKDLQSMWEEQFKSRSNLEERVAQLDREKAELFEQCESERKKVKKLVELKRPVELRLDQEMKRNLELQKDFKRLKRLLSRATKKLRVFEEREMESQLNLQGEMKNRYSEMVSEVGRLRPKVDELSQQLDMKSKKCMQLEAKNQDLQEELSTLRGKCENLEKSKCQLKEEVAKLQHHSDTNMVDRSQIEQYKREVEERAGQEIRQKLQEVNLFLQAQAASQDRLEQIRASHHASLRNQLKDRIRDLECELDRIKNTQQDSTFQKESVQAEVEKYKELYLEEVKTKKSLAKKLERANERLAEANTKLLRERHRSKSLITSSIVSGHLAASPVLYSTGLGHLGNSLGLNRSLSLGGNFLSPTENTLSSRNRVEAYVAKVRQELDEKITRELQQATAELERESAASSKHLHGDQDPLCRAIEEYRDVLTKNYLI